MKKRWLSFVLALVMVLGMIPATVPAAQAYSDSAVGAARSDRGNTMSVNASGNYEIVMVDGYLIQIEDGSLKDKRHLMVRTYSPEFQFLSERELEIELQEIGGVFFGQDYNFLVFGQDNWQERSDVEVLRVVKYSKSWQRLDAGSLYTNTVTDVVGQWGNLSFAEYNGMLYIHSGRSTNTLSDGQQHQTNMTFCVRQSDMEVTDTQLGISSQSTGYVSHALTQDILVDSQGRLVTADTGDAYPRGAYLYRYRQQAGGDTFYDGQGEGVLFATWPGKGGNVIQYPTNAQITSLAETDQGYLAAYIDTGIGSLGGTGYPYSAYLTFFPKDNLSDYTTRTLQRCSQYGPESTWGVQLIPTSSTSGYVLWYTTGPTENWIYPAASIEDYHYYYTTYSADGSFGEIVDLGVVPGTYSGPIYHDGKLVWADTSKGAEEIRFCTLDDTGFRVHTAAGEPEPEPTPDPEPEPDPEPQPSGTPTFWDVPESHWAYPYVTRAAENGWVAGMGDGTFSPNSKLTFAQFYVMVTSIFCADDLAQYQPDPGAAWWQKYMWVGGNDLQANTIWLDTHPVAGGNLTIQQSIERHANEAITRTDAISIMWRVLGEWRANEEVPGVDAAREKILADGVELNLMERDTVPVCYAAGLIAGDENGDLNLKGTLTRAEGCVMLCNLVDYAASHGIAMSGAGN